MLLEKASRNSWKTEPMPAARVRLELDRTFSQDEYEHLQWGLIHQEMEDKWFVYFEDGWLFVHRSWTGYCLYQLHVEPTASGWKIGEVWANDDATQFPLQVRRVFFGFVRDWLLDSLAHRQRE